jgi:hypothetical protein
MSLFGRRERREIRELNAYVDRLRAQRDKAVRGEETAVSNRQQVLAQYAALDEKYIAVCIVNNHLTEDLVKAAEDLAASRRVEGSLVRQIHAMAQPVEPSDTFMDDLNRVIAERDAEKRRADRLQRRLNDAVGLASPRPLDSSVWQPGYVAPKPDKETTS